MFESMNLIKHIALHCVGRHYLICCGQGWTKGTVMSLRTLFFFLHEGVRHRSPPSSSSSSSSVLDLDFSSSLDLAFIPLNECLGFSIQSTMEFYHQQWDLSLWTQSFPYSNPMNQIFTLSLHMCTYMNTFYITMYFPYFIYSLIYHNPIYHVLYLTTLNII